MIWLHAEFSLREQRIDEIERHGSTVVDSEFDPASDPDASNGGAHIIDLPVADRTEVEIRFGFPETDKLLIRRQPGLVTMLGEVMADGCDDSIEFTVDTDILLDFTGSCPSIDDSESG